MAARHSAATALRYLASTRLFWVLLLETMLAGFGICIFLNRLPMHSPEQFQMSLGSRGFVGRFITQEAVIKGLAGVAIFALLRGAEETSEKLCLCDVVPVCYWAIPAAASSRARGP